MNNIYNRMVTFDGIQSYQKFLMAAFPKFGQSNNVNAGFSVGWGIENQVDSPYSFVFGKKNHIAKNSYFNSDSFPNAGKRHFIFGENNKLQRSYGSAILLGKGLTVASNGEDNADWITTTVIGSYNQEQDISYSNAVLVIGTGSDNENRKNLLQLDYDGSLIANLNLTSATLTDHGIGGSETLYSGGFIRGAFAPLSKDDMLWTITDSQQSTLRINCNAEYKDKLPKKIVFNYGNQDYANIQCGNLILSSSSKEPPLDGITGCLHTTAFVPGGALLNAFDIYIQKEGANGEELKTLMINYGEVPEEFALNGWKHPATFAFLNGENDYANIECREIKCLSLDFGIDSHVIDPSMQTREILLEQAGNDGAGEGNFDPNRTFALRIAGGDLSFDNCAKGLYILSFKYTQGEKEGQSIHDVQAIIKLPITETNSNECFSGLVVLHFGIFEIQRMSNTLLYFRARTLFDGEKQTAINTSITNARLIPLVYNFFPKENE